MRQQAKKALKHPLIYGSTIVVSGGLLANFFNFLYNLFMSRTLSVTDYGILASITSLITFPSLFVTAISPVIIRFAGDYFVKGENKLLRGLYKKFFTFLFAVGLIFFILFLVFLSQIGNFFHISDNFILILADIFIFLSFISIVNMSFLQAKLAFGFQVIVNLVSAVLKVSIGVALVLVGYSVAGAVGALVLSSIGGFIIGFWPLKFLFRTKTQNPEIQTKELFGYGVPSALTLLGLISFISSDIILVKHFFSPIEAGQYAGLSLVGRIIFFVSAPIGNVMFPVIVQKHSKGINFSNTFKMAIGLVLLPSLLLTLFYYFFSNFSILFFLKRPDYLTVAPLLGLFGLYITFYCMLYLFANFYLSIKKTKVAIPIFVGALLQILLIAIFHQSFMQIIMISFVLVLLLVIGFLLYYPYATKKE
ncbi:MAG TPA: oligosaccharide flippase family protein [Candidatus Saccharimonadales bacterium]|nr:oligosaccharide flippase family protein [Candidatus Saccharimonadales bacterium]